MESSLFNILPEEIIVIILNEVPTYIIPILKLVCKDWYRLSKDLMGHHYIYGSYLSGFPVCKMSRCIQILLNHAYSDQQFRELMTDVEYSKTRSDSKYVYILSYYLQELYRISDKKKNIHTTTILDSNTKELKLLSVQETYLNLLPTFIIEYLTRCIDYDLYEEFVMIFESIFNPEYCGEIPHKEICRGLINDVYENFFEYAGKGKSINSVKIILFLLSLGSIKNGLCSCNPNEVCLMTQEIYVILLRMRKLIVNKAIIIKNDDDKVYRNKLFDYVMVYSLQYTKYFFVDQDKL